MENRMLSDEILLALIKKNSGGGQSAIHVKGATTTALTDGCDTNPITINGESYTAVDGDLVAYQSKEFLFNGTIWQELGDVSEVMTIIEKILDDIADEFDATTTYAIDDFVIKDSVLYKCISAHTGAWDANDFITTTVVDEIANKQNMLVVGKYIDITNGKISVDRVIPNESFAYNFKILELHTVHVTKTVNGAVVFEQDYTDATASTPIIFDDAIKFYADGYWYFEYELLIDSNSHNAGFKQRWSSLERNINYTEDFNSIDNTGKKLIIKSEMDDAIGALQDGQNIDSFGDVESALSDKQDVLTAGKYINIDANNEIKVNPVVPNEAFTYTFKVVDDNSVEIIKTVDDVVVFDEVYSCWDPVAQQQHDVNETFDNAMNINVYMTGQRSYTLLIASDTHEAGFKQTTPWWERNTFTETFSTVDHSGEKLITKSDMDTALAGKQDALSAGDYIKFEGNEISVKRLVLDGDEYTYDIYSKNTQTHIVVDKYDSNETLVSTREYYMNDLNPAVEVDGLFTLYAYGGPWTCTLLVASKDHAAGYAFSNQFNEYTHHTEIFELPPEESPNDLIIRSELDTALALKQDKTDNSLQTTDKTVVGAINEHEGDISSLMSGLINQTARNRSDITNRLTNLVTAVSEQNLEKYGYKIGDYFTGASDYTYILADMDTYYGGYNSGAIVNTHHIAVVVKTGAYRKWANTDDTSGGYKLSTLHSFLSTTALDNIKSDMIALFGGSTGLEHLVSHKLLWTTATSGAWEWSGNAEYISALSEPQVYGTNMWAIDDYQTGEAWKWLEVFHKFNFCEILGSSWWWLRSISSASQACRAVDGGAANGAIASGSGKAVGLIIFH